MALVCAVFLPLLAALLCWIKPLRKIAWGVTAICLALSFATAAVSSEQVIRHGRAIVVAGWIEIDGLGALVVLLVSFVCTLAAIFARGYMRHGGDHAERLW
ncbi:MAG: hypothetical protein WCC92_03010 [Candidatus Korobacteraceae bacterium]